MASDARDSVIQVRDLRKEYGSTVAVDDVSFDVREGEIFGLLGPNGAGKTTAVELLQGLRTPTSGDADVLGFDVVREPQAVTEEIGVVPQSFYTFDRLTVRENVGLVADMYADPLGVDAVIDRLDLGEYAGTRFHDLSGGYQRRTGIAMALVSDPTVLFLDEPTTGLDPAARRATWEQIERLPDLGTTVVLTTHYMDEVEYLADRVALLVEGHVEAVDTVPALVDTYAGDVKVVVHLTDEVDPAVEDELASVLADADCETYRDDTGDMVGVFGARQPAQDAFGRLHDVGADLSIDLVAAGMDDVFLELTGRPIDPSGGTLGSGGAVR